MEGLSEFMKHFLVCSEILGNIHADFANRISIRRHQNFPCDMIFFLIINRISVGKIEQNQIHDAINFRSNINKYKLIKMLIRADNTTHMQTIPHFQIAFKAMNNNICVYLINTHLLCIFTYRQTCFFSALVFSFSRTVGILNLYSTHSW